MRDLPRYDSLHTTIIQPFSSFVNRRRAYFGRKAGKNKNVEASFAAAARRGARFFLLETARRSDAAAVWRGMAQKALKKYAVYTCILLLAGFCGRAV